MLATKIKMNFGRGNSADPAEIDQVYISGNGRLTANWYSKAYLYDYLKINPGSIQVNIAPNPYVMPTLTPKNEKSLKSMPDEKKKDILLSLPKE